MLVKSIPISKPEGPMQVRVIVVAFGKILEVMQGNIRPSHGLRTILSSENGRGATGLISHREQKKIRYSCNVEISMPIERQRSLVSRFQMNKEEVHIHATSINENYFRLGWIQDDQELHVVIGTDLPKAATGGKGGGSFAETCWSSPCTRAKRPLR